MRIKILFKTFKPLLSAVCIALILYVSYYLGIDSRINNAYIYGFFFGSILYIIVNNRKKYIYDFIIKNDSYEIKYYNMLGLNKKVSFSKDFKIELLEKNKFNNILFYVNFSNNNESFTFYYLNLNIKQIIEDVLLLDKNKLL